MPDLGLVQALTLSVRAFCFLFFFAGAGLGVEQIGVVAAIHPGVWGLSQVATSALSDQLGRKWMIASGPCRGPCLDKSVELTKI